MLFSIENLLFNLIFSGTLRKMLDHIWPFYPAKILIVTPTKILLSTLKKAQRFVDYFIRKTYQIVGSFIASFIQ
jgi:hypothetical protein